MDEVIETKPFRTKERTEEQKAHDIELIAGYVAQRKTNKEIVALLNAVPGMDHVVTLPIITSDVLSLKNYYVNRRAGLTKDQKKSRELLILERLEREAWDAWARSKEDAVKQKQESNVFGSDAKGRQNSKKVIEKEGQVGDSKFLDILIRLHERRCKIEGLEAPTKNSIDLVVGVDQTQRIENLRTAFKAKIEAEIKEKQIQDENRSAIPV